MAETAGPHNVCSMDPSKYSPADMVAGVSFNLRYAGSIPIDTSMKNLDFDIRTALAKECIFRVCEAAGYVTAHKKRQVDKRIRSLVSGSDAPNLVRAGENVTLMISTRCISVASAETGDTLFFHSIPSISFASGGDQETADFVCYVGKEEYQGRHCFVFECGAALAQEVLSVVGQAFETRVQEFTQRAAPPESGTQTAGFEFVPSPESRSTSTLRSINISASPDSSGVSSTSLSRSPAPLIDFDPTPTPPPRNRGTPPTHVYVNDIIAATSSGGVEGELRKEVWYHGQISRQEAESLLGQDGDFLVRAKESQDQFVLTGMQNGAPRHLLLIDDSGEVRTRDRRFQSISHLINYHRDNNLPITSTESVLVLKTAVLRSVNR